MECHKICMFCFEPQTCKVNYTQHHGVCSSHLVQSSTIASCLHCNAVIPILEFKTCKICLKENKDLSSSCCKVLCQDCKLKNFCCPSCFKCESCFNNTEVLQKQDCGHVLCPACLFQSSSAVGCKVCTGLKIEQVESVEVSQEKSVRSSESFESPSKLNESLVKSESFTSNSRSEDEDDSQKFIVDVEICEPGAADEKLMKKEEANLQKNDGSESKKDETLGLTTEDRVELKARAALCSSSENYEEKGKANVLLVVLVVVILLPFKAVSFLPGCKKRRDRCSE